MDSIETLQHRYRRWDGNGVIRRINSMYIGTFLLCRTCNAAITTRTNLVLVALGPGVYQSLVICLLSESFDGDGRGLVFILGRHMNTASWFGSPSINFSASRDVSTGPV